MAARMKISSAIGAIALVASFAACSRSNNVEVQGTPAGGAGGASATPASLGKPCQTKAECPDGACVAGVCRIACNADTDCEAKSVCLSDGVASGCRVTDEASCTGTCANKALACGIDGTCRMPCTDKCGRDGLTCVAGTCVGTLEPGALDTWFSCQANAGYKGTFCGGKDGTTLSSCNATKAGTSALDTCASSGLCEAAAAKQQSTCVAPACKADQLACGGKDGATLQRCRPDGTALEDLPDHTCATAALCALARDASKPQAIADCPPPSCEASAGRCQDGRAEACNPGRTGFDVAATCNAPMAQCVPAGASCTNLGIDATEVTREAYAKFLVEVATKPPMQPQACAANVDFTPQANWSPSDQAMKTLPVSGVDWCDAFAYCKAQGKRLCGRIGGASLPKAEFADPSKSQWMNACTQGGQSTHTFGAWKGLPSQQLCNGAGNWATNETPQAVAAGSKSTCASTAPGYTGIFDLTGNVAEWEDACDASADAGTKTDLCHVRGGAYGDELQDKLACGADRTLARNVAAPDVGFRCCL